MSLPTCLAHPPSHCTIPARPLALLQVRQLKGIPPLVLLLSSNDQKVQRAAAGALRTLAFKNDANKNEIVEEGALKTLIMMLSSEDSTTHYEAIGVIGNLVHSSSTIKQKVLESDAL